MEQVFALMVVFALGEAPQSVGKYKLLINCQAAASAYINAKCERLDVSYSTGNVYGTCWGCMHGCTAENNIKTCGTDPRPTR